MSETNIKVEINPKGKNENGEYSNIEIVALIQEKEVKDI